MVFTTTHTDPNPFTPPPFEQLQVLYAESMLSSTIEIVPEEAEITDGTHRVGVGFAYEDELPQNRIITIRDLVADEILVSGYFSAYSKFAVLVPGTNAAVAFGWRPLFEDEEEEIDAQRDFHGSLTFLESSAWEMVQP